MFYWFTLGASPKGEVLVEYSNRSGQPETTEIRIESVPLGPQGWVEFMHVGIFSHHDPKSKITVTMNPKPNDKILFSRAVKIFNYPLREYFVVQPIDAS